VAILAVFTDLGEYRVEVASGAFHLLVHSAQRIFGIVVIKLENAPNRAPASGCVTVFAGNIQRSVGTACGGSLRNAPRRNTSGLE
jgi:hypothetical protein